MALPDQSRFLPIGSTQDPNLNRLIQSYDRLPFFHEQHNLSSIAFSTPAPATWYDTTVGFTGAGFPVAPLYRKEEDWTDITLRAEFTAYAAAINTTLLAGFYIDGVLFSATNIFFFNPAAIHFPISWTNIPISGIKAGNHTITFAVQGLTGIVTVDQNIHLIATEVLPQPLN